MADIRETGPVALKGLPGLNRSNNQNDDSLSLEDQWKMINSVPRSAYSSAPEESVGLSLMGANYGQSQYDEGLTSTSQLGDIGDIRYANQPWYDTLANGVGKMLGTAGTTFLSSLIGLPVGLEEAARQGRWSALWDNDVTQGLAKADEWLEQNMTNYQSQAQQNSPWWERVGDMNWWADDVIKNMGFTVGAAASMAVGSGALGALGKTFGLVNDVSKGTKITNGVLSALFSATGEGMIEARQGVEERNKLELQRFNDAMAPEKAALEMELQEIQNTDMDYNTYRQRMADWQAKSDALNQKITAGQQQIEESGREMGNKILLANQGLLTLGNLIQFGKVMTKSFDAARHAAETSSKFAKPFGMQATVKNAAKVASAENPYEIVGSKTLARIGVGAKGLLTEGSEEMNQEFIRQSSDYAYKEQDVNDYWRAKLDPEAYRETTKGLYTVGNILDRGFKDSWGDVNQWEQFVIGGLTGLAGSYTPTKLFNQDKSKAWYNPMRYGEWGGGAYNEIQDWNREYNQFSENIDDLNSALAKGDFGARVRSMVGHTYTEEEKTAAAEAGDKKSWKDADDKQAIHDIQAFVRAGKVDDLRAIYREMGKEMDEEDVENIIKHTTKEITAEEDKQNHDRNIDEQIASKNGNITSLREELDDLYERASLSSADGTITEDNYLAGEIADRQSKIAKAQQDIDALNQQKASYVGQRYFTGPYVDAQGNRTATDDEVRGTLKHNAEELNRKLDSYLESIAAVNEMTRGALSKEQEDNLAYLHNLSKEKIERMNKAMANARKDLPTTFLLKTNKTPEELTKEYASSDLAFKKDENTKEGYVEVDTSLMNDANFANFFQTEIMRGGNIRPEFGENAAERAEREEEEEKNLSAEEKKKRAREKASKKWLDALRKQAEDADEQWDTNWELLVDNFVNNFMKNNHATMAETSQAFSKVRQDLQDASNLFDEAGEFMRVFQEYMRNPEKVDKDRKKAENAINKAENEQQGKNKFAGKTAKEINQDIANGNISEDDAWDFADLSDITDEDVKAAQGEVAKANEIRQKAATLKGHLQDQLSDTPTPEELKAVSMASAAVDAAMLAADNPEDISIDNPYLSTAPLDEIPIGVSPEDLEVEMDAAKNMLADAFTAMQEDEEARDDIPDEAPSIDDGEIPETGSDSGGTVAASSIAPDPTPKTDDKIIPQNPLTESALGNIIAAVKATYEKPSNAGIWRSTTRRNPYHRTTGTYHEDVAKKQYGEDSLQYKRSKAIWEFLNAEGAFDRVDNTSADRLKAKDTIHLMAMDIAQEVYGKDYSELTEDEKPYATVIIMLNDNMEVLGDLPIAQWEKSNAQTTLLNALQNKIIKAFDENYKKTGSKKAIVDNKHKDGADNLNLKYKNGKPLVTAVKQVMRGEIPFSETEKNTLNDVAGDTQIQLGVRIDRDIIATKRGDRTNHTEIIKPTVGSKGQPYMLIPTPSGESIAVPFYTVAFDAAKHRGTQFYTMLGNAINYLIISKDASMPNSRRDAYYKKHLNVLESLLQVTRRNGVQTIEIKGDTVTLHIDSLVDANVQYDISVPNTGNSGQIAQAIVEQLSGIPINVSLEFLNGNIETGITDAEKKSSDYNRVIGELADINLPKNMNHTMNAWFTIDLVGESGTQAQKKVDVKTTGIHTTTINGRSIEIDTDRLIAKDAKTGEIITDDEDVNLALAEIQANKPGSQGKKLIQVQIGNQLRTYDTEKKEFVRTRTQTPRVKEATVSTVDAEPELPSIDEVSPLASDAADRSAPFIMVPEVSAEEAEKARKEEEKKARIESLKEKAKTSPIKVLVELAESDELSLYDEGLEIFKDTPYTRFVRGSKLLRTGDHYDWTTKRDKDLGEYIMKKYPWLKVGHVNESGGGMFQGMNLSIVTDEEGNEYGSPVNFLHAVAKKSPKAMEALSKAPKQETAETPTIENGQNSRQPTTPEPESTGKTLEQIEEEATTRGIVTDKTKDAWNVIPNDLKLKMFNEGASVELKFGTKTLVISADDATQAKEGLTKANMSAKKGKLSVSEAAKPMESTRDTLEREKQREARKWLSKNLPMLKSEERVQFVERLARAGDNAGRMWGNYRAGVIEIMSNAPMGTVYHEAFHYVMDMVLDNDERAEILRIAKEAYGVDNYWQAEERLANDFRRYAMDENATGIIGRIKRWIRQIRDKIMRYNRISDATVNQLFWKINNGQLAQKSMLRETSEDRQQAILREIRNVQKQRYAWSNLSADTKNAFKEAGLTEDSYNQMSLEEKEQWSRCRG